MLNGRVAVQIPDNHDDAEAFLEWLQANCPDLYWNDGSVLTEFCPYINIDRVPQCFHRRPDKGLMFDSNRYVAEMLSCTIVTVDEMIAATSAKIPDVSDFLDQLL